MSKPTFQAAVFSFEGRIQLVGQAAQSKIETLGPNFRSLSSPSANSIFETNSGCNKGKLQLSGWSSRNKI
jgi:hypothetical protein